jgi:hypothetical protein
MLSIGRNQLTDPVIHALEGFHEGTLLLRHPADRELSSRRVQ